MFDTMFLFQVGNASSTWIASLRHLAKDMVQRQKVMAPFRMIHCFSAKQQRTITELMPRDEIHHPNTDLPLVQQASRKAKNACAPGKHARGLGKAEEQSPAQIPITHPFTDHGKDGTVLRISQQHDDCTPFQRQL